MLATILQVTIPLAYIFFGILCGRYAWQNMREVPRVTGTDPVNCTALNNEYHSHFSSCYEIIQEESGDDFDAGMTASLVLFFWPVALLIAFGYMAVTSHTPQTAGEKILALRKAEEELKKATRRMEAAKQAAENWNKYPASGG